MLCTLCETCPMSTIAPTRAHNTLDCKFDGANSAIVRTQRSQQQVRVKFFLLQSAYTFIKILFGQNTDYALAVVQASSASSSSLLIVVPGGMRYTVYGHWGEIVNRARAARAPTTRNRGLIVAQTSGVQMDRMTATSRRSMSKLIHGD